MRYEWVNTSKKHSEVSKIHEDSEWVKNMTNMTVGNKVKLSLCLTN
jgi:hypothetical protein